MQTRPKTKYTFARLSHNRQAIFLLLAFSLGAGLALASVLGASASSLRMPIVNEILGNPPPLVANPSPLKSAQDITATTTITSLLKAITVTTTGMATARSGPGLENPELATFAPNLTFDATGRSPDSQWVMIQLSKWQNAWVQASLVKPGGYIQGLAEAALPASPGEAAPIITEKPVISARSVSGSNSSITLSVGGLTPGKYYSVQIVNQKGKTVYKRAANANGKGFMDFSYGGSSTWINALNPGTYTVTVYYEGVPIGSKQFTLAKS